MAWPRCTAIASSSIRDRDGCGRVEGAGALRAGLRLELDLAPPLKLRAKALRAEISRLEAEVHTRGLDPDTIDLTVDEPTPRRPPPP